MDVAYYKAEFICKARRLDGSTPSDTASIPDFLRPSRAFSRIGFLIYAWIPKLHIWIKFPLISEG
jgi:hypothetical protein